MSDGQSNDMGESEASSIASPGPAVDDTVFHSRTSAINIQKNVSSKTKEPLKRLILPRPNSNSVDETAMDLNQLVLTSQSSETQNQRNKPIRKIQKKRERTQLPPESQTVDFNRDNPQIRNYFKNDVGPLYAGSSAQYLENLAHHPQFQYQVRAPHSAPLLQDFNQVPLIQHSFTPPPYPGQMYNQHSAYAMNRHQFNFQNNYPSSVPHTQNIIKQRPQNVKTFVNSSYCQQNRNNQTQAQFEHNGNQAKQNHQYLQNLEQHPLLRNTIQGSQQTRGPVNKCHKKKRNKDKIHQFDDYISEVEVEEGLKNNTLRQGVIRINPKNHHHAYLTVKDDELDIFIDGLKYRNRALEGDIVVVQLIETSNKEVEENEGEETESKEEDPQDEEIKEETRNNPRGKVVFVKEKVHSRICTGYLKLMPDKNRQRALFLPRDYRIPRINIPFTSWPDNFYQQEKDYENTLFLAKIIDWWDDRFAMGTILRAFGQAGDLHTETTAILLECSLDVTPFGPEVKKFFPGTDYSIPLDEIAKREDCRKLCIFSIDPATCRDIDDAMSCRPLENGNFEIGVHISDVSHYLKENTMLDLKVADKATTIYLVEKAYHMLPEELCMICSLFPGIDKLAFSVFWEITDEGKVLSTRFAKTVINSCAQLAYEHAQGIIEDAEIEVFPEIYNGFTFVDIQCVVKVLGKLSSMFRQKRFEDGALRIDQQKLGFRLNPETGLPDSFHIYQSQPSHQLIEEFMLLANMSVAEQIYKDHPKLAFLRCHPEPSKFQLESLVKQLKTFGIDLDVSSAGSIYKSILPYIGTDNDNEEKAIAISMMCTKPMTRAKYFCAHGQEDDQFSHYALNVPLYTHFTSPIRRYADIMVHRLLSASMQYTEMPKWDVARVQEIAANCNAQKYNAKRAGEKSTELYTLKYIEANSPVRAQAVVVDVKKKFFDVIVMALAFNRRVFVDNIPDATSVYSMSQPGVKLSKLELTWPATDTMPETKLNIELFSVVQVDLVRTGDVMKVDTKLVKPL